MDYKKLYNEWTTSSYFDEDTKRELLAIKGDEKEIEDIRKRVQDMGYDPSYYVHRDIVFQKPYAPYSGKNTAHAVWVLKEDGSISELEEASEIVHALTKADLKEEQKVYYPKEKL